MERTEPLKLLFVINNLYTRGNGLSASARRTITLLRERGHDVRVLSSGSAEQAQACDFTAPEFALPARRFPLADAIISAQGYAFAKPKRKVIKQAVDWADVVHLEEPFGLQARTAHAAKRAGKPALATYHIHPENITATIHLDGLWPLNALLLASWRRRIYALARVVQCPSDSVHQRLQRWGMGDKLVTISNGVGLAPSKPAAGTKTEYCAPGGRQVETKQTPGEAQPEGEQVYRLLVVGRFSREKDQATILKAMRHSRYASQIQLVFAGRGPTEKSLRRAASRLVRDGVLKHAPSFNFFDAAGLDAQAEQADLYIHAAFIEVEGLSCLEVLRHGVVPVIAHSPLTATSQFALDAHSRFKARDPKALARAIDYWLSDNDRRQTEAQKYLNIGAHYDINDCVSRLELVYRKLASSKAS
ncbi:MAG: glycosyltransferase [Actinomyces graevenitzii]|nr:glycosyltransferase [Actinomyces graevenitzii]